MPKLANNEMGGFTDAIRLTVADLKAIGTGGTKVIATIPAGGAVELVGSFASTAIVGSSSLALAVGISGTAGAFVASNVAASATTPVYNTGSLFTAGTGTTGSGMSQAVSRVATATPIILTVTDAALASITAGEIVIGLRILDLGRFRND